MRTATQERSGDLLVRLSTDLDASFADLMRTYQDRLYAFALHLSGDSQDAEEIVQDAFVRAYRALQEYDHGRVLALAVRPWLYQITLNCWRNRIRGKRLPVTSLDGEAEDGANEPAAREADRPERLAELAETRGELAAVVAELPDRYRAAVVLRFVEELSYGEIASILDQPTGTVKANVHRGIEHLRARIAAPVTGGR